MNRVRADRWLRSTLLAVLVLLVSAVVFVIWILPGLVDRWATPGPVSDSPPRAAPIVAPAAPDARQLEQARAQREAETALRELLTRQAALEGQQVGIWGGQDYEAALQRLAEADVAFADARYVDAAGLYAEVIERFQALAASRPQRLQQALAHGEEALMAYDSKTARRQFGVALAIDPDHAGARRGMARADTLQQVAALLADGAEHEAAGNWVSALESYQAAARLDPDAAPPAEGVARSNAALETARFRAAMSQTLTAIDGGELERAREALSHARRLRPDAVEVGDAERRLRAATQDRRIAGYRDKARRLEGEERWPGAVEAYQAVLAIDGEAQFARLGLARAQQLATLHAQLDRYLGAPERLASPGPRANAASLLREAHTLGLPGPRLATKLDELEELMGLATTPVTVLIRSDDHTEISIDHVGSLGRLTERQITLLPGSYRVRGSRLGYRDQRLKVEVQPGAVGQVIDVRCTERI